MSEMLSYQRPESPPPPAGDRRGGLIAWGVVLIVIGVGVGVLAVAAMGPLLAPLDAQPAPRTRGRAPASNVGLPQLRELLTGIVLMSAAAAGLVWTGIASCLGRRWTRPVVMIASALVCIVSLLAVVDLALRTSGLVDLADQGRTRSNPTQVLVAVGLRLALILALGVVLPWIMFRFYASLKTLTLLNELDPRWGWADRAPVPVLGWAAISLLTGASCLLNLAAPRLPFFIVTLNGPTAIIGLVVLGIALLWGAWLCYRLDRVGIVLSSIAMILLLSGAAVATWLGENTPSPTVAAARPAAVVPMDWVTAVILTLQTLLAAGLAVYAYRFFTDRYQMRVLS